MKSILFELICVCFGCVFILLCPGFSYAFNVGPYYLGMSNKEAKKIGLGVCRMDSYDRVVCKPLALSIDGFESDASLWFNSENGILTEIRMEIRKRSNPPYTYIETIMGNLQIRPCQAGRSQDSVKFHGWCYEPPDQTRLITEHWKQFRYEDWRAEVSVKIDRKHVESFYKSKARQLADAERVKKIQEGR